MKKSEEMKRLEEAMASDKELKEKLYRIVDRIAGEGAAETDSGLFSKAAEELGFHVTAADFERLDAEKEEISVEELENVAGGGWCLGVYVCAWVYHEDYQDTDGHNGHCIAVWHCATAALHTDDGNEHVGQESCWKEYQCVFKYLDYRGEPIGTP